MESSSLTRRVFGLDAEADLDPTIVPQSTPVDLSANPGAIFLTGVTGFIGAFLLRDLLRATQADIYCLVRANHPTHGEERIRHNLESNGLWDAAHASRVKVVVGDLKRPLLGLTPGLFQWLADRIDVIYHCGSKLSYVAPYEYLRDANVGGTQETLRLATMGKAKPFHYVSSLGILLAYKTPTGGQETDELDASRCPDVGYFQTKYVAEKIVRQAQARGIPVTIHRIGLIVGDSETGVSNADDFVARMLVGCIEAGFAPDVRNAMDMTPVNYISQAMLYLARQPESVGRVFHLLNPTPIHWSDIFDRVIDAGYPVQKYPFEAWIEAIRNHADPANNPLVPLLPFFFIEFAQRMLGINEWDFHRLGTAATQRALSGSGLTCAPVDKRLVNTFLAQLVRSHRLHSAPTPQVTAEPIR